RPARGRAVWTGAELPTRIQKQKSPVARDGALSASADSGGHDAHIATAEGALHFELDRTVHLGEQGVVLADAHAHAGVVLGAALTHDDVAGLDGLAAEQLHAKAFTFGVAAVAGRTASFFVCHESNPPKGIRPGCQ